MNPSSFYSASRMTKFAIESYVLEHPARELDVSPFEGALSLQNAPSTHVRFAFQTSRQVLAHTHTSDRIVLHRAGRDPKLIPRGRSCKFEQVSPSAAEETRSKSALAGSNLQPAGDSPWPLQVFLVYV